MYTAKRIERSLQIFHYKNPIGPVQMCYFSEQNIETFNQLQKILLCQTISV